MIWLTLIKKNIVVRFFFAWSIFFPFSSFSLTKFPIFFRFCKHSLKNRVSRKKSSLNFAMWHNCRFSISTFTKEVMNIQYRLFICLFVCKITQKVLDGFRSNFHRICIWWLSTGDSILVLIRPGKRIREGFKIQKQVNNSKLWMDFAQIFTESL